MHESNQVETKMGYGLSAEWEKSLQELHRFLQKACRFQTWISVDYAMGNWTREAQKHMSAESLVKSRPENFDIEFANGSGSGSLIGFAKCKGLVPAGELMQRTDVVPFTGELQWGITQHGVSQKSVSFSPDLTVVRRDYADKCATQIWNPEMSLMVENYERQQAEDFFQRNIPLYREIHLQRLNIEYARRRVWETLASEEKSFLQNPFPVIYGLVGFKKADFTGTKFDEFKASHLARPEVVHQGYLPVEDENDKDLGRLVAYVPDDKIEMVQNYLRSNGVEMAVESLAGYEYVDFCRRFRETVVSNKQGLVDGLIKKYWPENLDSVIFQSENDRRQLSFYVNLELNKQIAKADGLDEIFLHEFITHVQRLPGLKLYGEENSRILTEDEKNKVLQAVRIVFQEFNS